MSLAATAPAWAVEPAPYVEVFLSRFNEPAGVSFETELFVFFPGAATVELRPAGETVFFPLVPDDDEEGGFFIETDEEPTLADAVDGLNGQVRFRVDGGLPSESVYRFNLSLGSVTLGDFPAPASIVSPLPFEAGVSTTPTIQWVPGGGQERVVGLAPVENDELEVEVGTPFGTLDPAATQWAPPELDPGTLYELLVLEADRRQDLTTGLVRVSGQVVDWGISPFALPGSPDATPLVILSNEVGLVFTTAEGGLVGDLNGDGFVGAGDLDILLGVWNQSVGGGVPADLNGDGFIGAGDLDILLGNWNAGTPGGGASAVPEPGALGLAAAGTGFMLMRRRRGA